ncbi:hypothetical protein KR018_001136 [Drosophila ironensis]|nr:hypothetical protein KR018_001136 [Drosophila ironensis]
MKSMLLVLALLGCGLVFAGAQSCQECQADNDVYCYNQTSYQYCMGSTLFGEIETCPTGTVCSNSEDVCVESSAVDTTNLDVCGASGGNGVGCADCSVGLNYVCVSRTQFARCSGAGAVTTSVFSCSANETCINGALQLGNSICVPDCAADYVNMDATCSNSEYQPVTTTAAPATTPSTADQQEFCRSAEPSSSPSFFYARNYDDSTCNTYIYCQKSGTDTWLTVNLKCKGATLYFDTATSTCVSAWPASCSATLATSPSSPESDSTTASSTSDSSTASTTSDSSTASEATTAASTAASGATSDDSTTTSATSDSTTASSTSDSSTESTTSDSSTESEATTAASTASGATSDDSTTAAATSDSSTASTTSDSSTASEATTAASTAASGATSDDSTTASDTSDSSTSEATTAASTSAPDAS